MSASGFSSISLRLCAGTSLYGRTAEEAVGKVTSHQLLRPILPAPLDEINTELLRTGRWDGELVQTKANGTQVVVASRWSLQRDERQRPLAILELNGDVTEHKRAEENLPGTYSPTGTSGRRGLRETIS